MFEYATPDSLNPLNSLAWLLALPAAIAIFYAFLSFIPATRRPRIGICMNRVYQKSVILRFGSFLRVQNSGFFFAFPIIRTVAATLDTRIITDAIVAERILTTDTISLDIKAIIQWHIIDPERSFLELEDVYDAVQQISQTTLREMAGSQTLDALLHDRNTCDEKLATSLKNKTGEWGVEIDRVEIKDITLDQALQAAMSVQARATREREARLTLASVEADIAAKNLDAAEIYENNPIAFKLRQMSILKEISANPATIIVPADYSEAMTATLAIAEAAPKKQIPAPTK